MVRTAVSSAGKAARITSCFALCNHHASRCLPCAVGTFDSQGEAAVARSLALAFHQHSQGAPLSGAKPRLLHTLARCASRELQDRWDGRWFCWCRRSNMMCLPRVRVMCHTCQCSLLPSSSCSLQNQKATLREVRARSDWASLRDLLQQWQASGKLRRLAASLALATPVPSEPAAAAAAAAAPRATTQGVRKRRALGRQAREGAEAAGAESPAQRAVAGAAAPTPGQAARRHGEEAVGRRVRVWLQLDDEVEQQHEGRVAEFTPTG